MDGNGLALSQVSQDVDTPESPKVPNMLSLNRWFTIATGAIKGEEASTAKEMSEVYHSSFRESGSASFYHLLGR